MNNEGQLESRLRHLEQRVKDLEQKLSYPVSSKETFYPEEKVQTKISNDKYEPTWINSFIKWLKEDWLMKLGASLLIIALMWFVTYAFANNWIGPMGRISLGIATGIAILGLGHYFIPKKRVPGEVLVVTGMMMLILSVFAGKFFYDFYSSTVALGIMTLTVGLSATISILRESKSVAVTSVIASGIVPMLIGGFENTNSILLLCYLLIIDLGVLIVVTARGWRSLIILSLLITTFYASGAFDVIERPNADKSIIWIFMGIFYFLFLISNFLAIWKNKASKLTDLFIAGLNSLVVLGWIFVFVPKDWQSIILSALAVLSLGLVAIMLKQLKFLKNNIFIYGGTALAFIIAATAFELKEYDAALIIAFSIEIMLATYFTKRFIEDDKAASVVSLLQTVPIIMLYSNDAFEYYSWENVSIINEHLIALIIIILSLLTSGYFLRKTLSSIPIVHFVTASLLGILLIWFSMFNLISNFDIARGVSLVIYTLVGVISMFLSYKKGISSLRIGSGILLGGVVLRLFIVEFWEMPISGKVITSFLVGTLLVITAFFNKKLTSKSSK